MLISPPFLPPLPANTNTPAPSLDPMMDAVDKFEMRSGIYPIAFDRRWHCGVHLQPDYHPIEVRAIADGEVVAYRVCQKAISDGSTDPVSGAPLLNSNTGFVLLKHTTETGEGRSITFYSLYMHLLDFDNIIGLMGDLPPLGSTPHVIPEWLRTSTNDVAPGNGKKVYRKDVLGYLGKCHDEYHLHFEIFMLPSDFEDYFGKTQIGNQQPATPEGTDYWGHSYYIVPPEQIFLPQPTGTNAQNKLNGIEFAPLQGGQNETTLHVETYFHKGNKYTHVWAVDAEGKRTRLTEEAPTPEKDYEYDLYKRATKLYPACPSDGYELLRFGRILSSPATIPAGAGRTTWMRMTFASGQEGYLDINNDAIVKLSDADFPALQGWQKITEGNTPFSDDGLCDIDGLRKMLGDAPAMPESDDAEAIRKALGIRSTEMSRYLSDVGNEHVREQLRGFVCETHTEWDAARLEQRYGKLKEEGEFFHGKEDSYNAFIAFVKKFCFWDKTGLPEGKLWFFHPLQFIRFFRRCGWLSVRELSQVVQKTNSRTISSVSNLFVSELRDPQNNQRVMRPSHLHAPLMRCMRKHGISTPLRCAHWFAQILQETGTFQYMRELGSASYLTNYYEDRCNSAIQRTINGQLKTLSPLGNCNPGDGVRFSGKGMIQITCGDNYRGYQAYRGGVNFTVDPGPESLISDANNACDAGGYYWISKQRYRKDPVTNALVPLGSMSVNFWADKTVPTSLVAAQVINDPVDGVTKCVNAALEGGANRRSYFKHAYSYLSDISGPFPPDFRPLKE